jgi:four helix bundle protein
MVIGESQGRMFRMDVNGLEKLETWKKAKEFALRVYREVLPLLPAEEKWGLGAQLRRAATSIPANIAEGHGRYYYQDNIRFCYNARGSLEEVASHLALAYEMKFIPEQLFSSLEDEAHRLVQLVNGYIAYLRKSKQGQNEPGADHSVREVQSDYGPEMDIIEDI